MEFNSLWDFLTIFSIVAGLLMVAFAVLITIITAWETVPYTKSYSEPAWAAIWGAAFLMLGVLCQVFEMFFRWCMC